MARTDIRTHLTLDRFAAIMGIAPVHFNGGAGATVWPPGVSCQDIWPQYSWQHNDVISRFDLAEAIRNAEEDIKRVLRMPVAPEYIVDKQSYPSQKRVGLGANTLKIPTMWRNVLEAGPRAVSAVKLGASVVRSDPDGDGFKELATITVIAADLPTGFDIIKARIYTPGRLAHPTHEIRYPTLTIDGSDNLVITLESWLLFDPALWEKPITLDGFTAIDADSDSSYLATVDVYQEYTDTTADGVTFHWYGSANCSCGGIGCPDCNPTEQGGCLTVANTPLGLVVPAPAGYDVDTTAWVKETFSVTSYSPEMVTLRYKSGYVSQDYLLGFTNDPLDQYLAEAIAWLAAARLEAPPCSCGVVQEKFANLRVDINAVSRERSVLVSVISPEMLTNPFGSRRGEVNAWNRIARLISEIPSMAGGSL